MRLRQKYQAPTANKKAEDKRKTALHRANFQPPVTEKWSSLCCLPAQNCA
jgi:hypothetical protein